MNSQPKCALCAAPAGRTPRRLHPIFALRSFTLCVPCESQLRHRLVDAGCTPRHPPERPSNPASADSAPENPAPKSPHSAAEVAHVADPRNTPDVPPTEEVQQAARLVTLAEELLWAARGDRDAAAIRARVREDEHAGAMPSPPPLGVDRAIITVARAVLTAVGVGLVGGRLVFPVGPIALPPLDDAHAAVEAALLPFGAGPRSGAAAWNVAFPDCSWAAGVPLRALYQRLYSLFGVRIAPPLRVSRRRAVEHLALDPVSVSRAMAAAARIAPPALKSLLAPPGHNLPSQLTHAAAAVEAATMLDGQPKAGVCACCGCEQHYSDFPFRIAECAGCEKQICSICLLRVFGPAELARAFTGTFRCPNCRLLVAASAPTKREIPVKRMRKARSELLQKRLTVAIRGRGCIAKVRRPKLPLLVIKRALALSLQGLGTTSSQAESECALAPSRSDIGFAKLCDDINFGSAPASNAPVDGPPELKPIPTTVCITCCLPLGAPPDSGSDMDFTFPVYQSGVSRSGLVRCSDQDCNIVVHAACAGLAPVPGDAPPPVAAEWKCRRHECEVCAAPAVEVRCRTCPLGYCHDHAPMRDNVHQYSAEWISCHKCKEMLDGPRFPHVADATVRIENGANAFTLSEAFQRERGFDVVLVNSIATMQDTVDTRDAIEVRAGVAKFKALRSRRAHRDAEKRVQREDLRAALEKDINDQANEKAHAIAKEKSNEKSNEKSTEKSTDKSTEKSTDKFTEKSAEKSSEKSNAKSTAKSTEKIRTTNASANGVVNGKIKSKARGSRERDATESSKPEKLGLPNGISKSKHKSRAWREREANGREKGRSSREKDVREREAHGGTSKSRSKFRTEKEREGSEKASVPNGKPKNKSKGTIRANGSASNVDAMRSGHRVNVDGSGGANVNRSRPFPLRSYPNGIRK